MATRAIDVAEEVLRALREPVNSVVLEKVLYYCQAWSLVWRRRVPIFPQRIEAWANGPVVPSVYACHRQHGWVRAGEIVPEPRPLDPQERDVVAAVAPFYAAFGADGLITLSHGERPWRIARHRAGVGPGERSNEVILLEDMADFYGQLWSQGAPHLPSAPAFVF